MFNDSLPDGWGKLLTDRLLKKKGYSPSEFTVIDRLSLVGHHGMEALTYHPAQDLTDDETTHQLDYYANEVAKILKADASAALDEIFDKAGSSGGARPKVLLNIDGTDWLIKFRASGDPEEVSDFSVDNRFSKMLFKPKVEFKIVKPWDFRIYSFSYQSVWQALIMLLQI